VAAIYYNLLKEDGDATLDSTIAVGGGSGSFFMWY